MTSSKTSSSWKYFFWHNLGRSFHIWSQIEAVLNISKFLKWPPFWARQTFFTGSYTGNWIYQNDSHEHFRHFELLIDAVTQILTEIYDFKIWHILWPGDVINEVRNIYLYNCSYNLMIHMHRKFNYDIFSRCLVMQNVVMSYIKEYRVPTLRPPCDVIDDVIIMKILFFGIIWDDLFISEVKLKLWLIFQNFQNGRHFEFATNFFNESYTGRRIYQKDSHGHFRHFELLIDAIIQILTDIYHIKNLTYLVTWWRHQWRHEYVFI